MLTSLAQENWIIVPSDRRLKLPLSLGVSLPTPKQGALLLPTDDFELNPRSQLIIGLSLVRVSESGSKTVEDTVV